MNDSTNTPSFFSYWRELLAFMLANWVFVGVVLRAIANDLWVATFDRVSDRVYSRIDSHYKERRLTIDAALVKVEVHEDELEAVKASMIEQGKAIREQMTKQHEQSTDTMLKISETLEKVQDEAAALAQSFADINGYLRGQNEKGKTIVVGGDDEWDGVTERRKPRPRRARPSARPKQN